MGSEMCIRDSPMTDAVDLPRTPAQRRAREDESEGQAMEGVTGSGMTVAASRSRTWERDDDPASPKRWKPSGEIGAIFEDMWGFLETEIVDVLGAVEENYFYRPEVDERRRLRLEEVDKLASFAVFQPLKRELVPSGTRVFKHTWVDTSEKSRLAVQDLRRFGSDAGEIIHCPTPSHYSNNVFDYFAAVSGQDVIAIDVVSAFVHASETVSYTHLTLPTKRIV